jgi:hypothetical protein
MGTGVWCIAISRAMEQNFSAVETTWRREVDSNFAYPFRRSANLPRVSELHGFHSRNEGGREATRTRPPDQ